MAKQDPTMFLKAGMTGLLFKTGTLPENAVGFAKVLSQSGGKVNLELDDATAKVDWLGEKLTANTKVFFNADGKMVSFEKAASEGASTRAHTGAVKDVRPDSVY